MSEPIKQVVAQHLQFAQRTVAIVNLHRTVGAADLHLCISLTAFQIQNGALNLAQQMVGSWFAKVIHLFVHHLQIGDQSQKFSAGFAPRRQQRMATVEM